MTNEDYEIIVNAMNQELEFDPQLKEFLPSDPVEREEMAELYALSAAIADPEPMTFTVS